MKRYEHVRIWPALVATVATTTAPATAQELLRIIEGRAFDRLSTIESLSDVDGDQVDDLLVVGHSGLGTHMVRSGRTDEILWGPLRVPPSTRAPATRVLGDFDGDGTDDVAVGYSSVFSGGPMHHVHVVDGATGADIVVIDVGWSPTGGQTVGDPGDVNGDGYADVLVGGSGETRRDIHLGPDGRYAYSIFGYSNITPSTRGIGDVTGDGKDDFAIGWLLAERVTIYSGEDGSEVYNICSPDCASPSDNTSFGGELAPLGDVDGDQVPDLAVRKPGAVHPIHGVVGSAQVRSGVDGSLLHESWGQPTSGPVSMSYYATNLGGGHDVNGDGIGDFVVTTSIASFTPGVSNLHSVVSGNTSQIVQRIRLLDPRIEANLYPTTLSDLDADGYAEWAFADRDYDGPIERAGRIWIYKGGPGDAETICLGATNSAGSMATLTTFGPIQHRTRELDLVVEGAVPNAFGHVVYGDEAAASPFGDGDLCIDPASLRFYGTCFVTDTTGRASVHADWGRPQIAHGPGAWLPGSTWVLQAVYRDAGGPSGFTTTSALRVQFFGG